jgi:hypothetical protein
MRVQLSRVPSWLLTGLWLALAGACGENDDDDLSTATVPCDEEPRAEPFSVDMEKTGDAALAIFTLHSIDPDPSDIGDNDWQMSARSAEDDTPLSGCDLDILPFMPDHEHGSNQPHGVEGEPSHYSIAGLRFIMPGYWRNTITITCPGDENGAAGLTDTTIYGFCVEG